MTDLCSGTKKNGQRCGYKAAERQPGMMWTCRIHQDQQKVQGHCQAPLNNGAKCQEIYEWKPHGFSLCATHSGISKPCYFLKIPKEVRLLIYQFVLPDRSINSHSEYLHFLTHGRESVNQAIFRVNHQIHDEATALLYRSSQFTIGHFDDRWNIYNATQLLFPIGCYPFLHHSNTEHIRVACKNKEEKDREPDSGPITAPDGIDLPLQFPLSHAHGLIESSWNPPLSDKYFNMIRRFNVEIDLYLPSGEHTVGNPFGASVVEKQLYEYCDNLHKLIGKLQLVQVPNAHLSIVITLRHNYMQLEHMFAAAQVLLTPFQRLKNIARIRITSITVISAGGLERELFGDDILTPAGSAFSDFTKNWAIEQPSSEPIFGTLKVFNAYWKLEALISRIKHEYRGLEGRFEPFADLLHAARIARENDDPDNFRVVWDRVVVIWQNFVREQREFQSGVAHSIVAIYRGADTGGQGDDATD